MMPIDFARALQERATRYANELSPEQVQELRKSTQKPVYLSFRTGEQVEEDAYAQELTELVAGSESRYPIEQFDPKHPLAIVDMKLQKLVEYHLRIKLTAKQLSELTGLPLDTINAYNSGKRQVTLPAFAAIIDGLAVYSLGNYDRYAVAPNEDGTIGWESSKLVSKRGYSEEDKGDFAEQRKMLVIEFLELEDPTKNELERELWEAEIATDKRILTSKHIALIASTLSDKDLELLHEVAKRLDREARMPKTLYDPRLLAQNDPDPVIEPTSYREAEYKALHDLNHGNAIMDLLLQIMFCSIRKDS